MKIILQASTLVLGLGLGGGAALAQSTPANQPPPAGNVAQEAGPAKPAPKEAEVQPPARTGFGPGQPGDVQSHSPQSRVSGVETSRPSREPRPAHVHWSGEHRLLRHAHWRQDAYAVRPSYEVAAEKRRLAYRAGYRRGLRAATVYVYKRPAYRYRARPVYVARVAHAYAETPFAYDLPRETYATGIFPTTSAIGLHTYDYAYTTRIRPIATYAGATGSYAGGYPIYNRPLVPAYLTCPCY